MPVTFYRHALSTWNSHGDRSRDVPLSKAGIAQAALLTGEYDIVVLSPLKRCRQTLDHSKIKFADIMITHLCREKYGDLAGDHLPLGKHAVETEEQFRQRLVDFRVFMADLQTKYERIAVITHHTFLHKLTGYDFENAHWFTYQKFE